MLVSLHGITVESQFLSLFLSKFPVSCVISGGGNFSRFSNCCWNPVICANLCSLCNWFCISKVVVTKLTLDRLYKRIHLSSSVQYSAKAFLLIAVRPKTYDSAMSLCKKMYCDCRNGDIKIMTQIKDYYSNLCYFLNHDYILSTHFK